MRIAGFPPIIVISRKNRSLVNVSGAVKKYYHGPTKFNYSVTNFADLFKPLAGSFIPKKKRWNKEDCPLKVNVLSFSQPQIARHIAEITRIANAKGAYDNSPLGASLRKRYRKNLQPIFKLLRERNKDGDQVVRIAVLRAGRTAASLMGYKKGQYHEVEAKRLPLINGSLAVGLSGRNISQTLSKKNLNGKILEFEEVCGASMATISAFIVALYSKGIRPRKIVMNAPVIVQQGAETLIKLCRALDFNLQINAGKVYHGLNEKWYIHTDKSRQEMAVGDAGDLCQL